MPWEVQLSFLNVISLEFLCPVSPTLKGSKGIVIKRLAPGLRANIETSDTLFIFSVNVSLILLAFKNLCSAEGEIV